jgi:hypothetical protein
MALLRRGTAAPLYAGVVGGFLFVRAMTTLVVGASFVLPGSGWRALFQLVVVAVLAAGLRSREHTPQVVIAVGGLYAVVTAIGIASGHDLLGVIPLDARDRIVHPLLAVAGLACGAVSLPRDRYRPTTGVAAGRKE